MKILSFKDYLKESTSVKDADHLNEMALIVEKYCKENKNQKIIWRGFNKNARSFGSFVEVTNDRESSKGQIFDVVRHLVKLLKFNFGVTSCTYSLLIAKFFGNPNIVIPTSDFRVFYSEEIEDMAHLNRNKKGNVVLTDDQALEIAKNSVDKYKILENKFPPSNFGGEILLDIKNYILASPKGIIDIARKSKFNKINKVEEIKTYEDLLLLIKNYLYFTTQKK